MIHARKRTACRHAAGLALVVSALSLAAMSSLAATVAASVPGTAASTARPQHAGRPAQPAKLIDLNNANRAELKTLPGIGDAEADRILAKRPFNSKAGLVTEAGLPAGTYISIKRRIYVGPPAKPTSRPPQGPR